MRKYKIIYLINKNKETRQAPGFLLLTYEKVLPFFVLLKSTIEIKIIKQWLHNWKIIFYILEIRLH